MILFSIFRENEQGKKREAIEEVEELNLKTKVRRNVHLQYWYSSESRNKSKPWPLVCHLYTSFFTCHIWHYNLYSLATGFWNVYSLCQICRNGVSRVHFSCQVGIREPKVLSNLIKWIEVLQYGGTENTGLANSEWYLRKFDENQNLLQDVRLSIRFHCFY